MGNYTCVYANFPYFSKIKETLMQGEKKKKQTLELSRFSILWQNCAG